MALTTVNITGTFNFPDATWSQYTKAEFHLSGYDTDVDVVVPKVTSAALGALGELDVDLWGNDDGLRGTVYRVNVVIYEDSGYSREVLRRDLGKIQITGDGPLDIAALIDSPVFVPEVWYRTITQAEYDAVIAAAAAAAASAAEAALFDGPKFDTIALMSAYASAVDGDFSVVWNGDNGEHEVFKYVAASVLAADGALVVTATGMGVGQWISQRTEFTSFAEFTDDARTFTVGTTLTIPTADLAVQSVSSGGTVTNAGGQGFVYLRGDTLTAAATSGAKVGTATSVAPITLGINESVKGSGRQRVSLTFGATTGTAINTPDSSVARNGISGVSLFSDGLTKTSGDVGIDAADSSFGLWQDYAIWGFDVGFIDNNEVGTSSFSARNLHMAYEINSCTLGFRHWGANANSWLGGRVWNCTTGHNIDDSEALSFFGENTESCGTAYKARESSEISLFGGYIEAGAGTNIALDLDWRTGFHAYNTLINGKRGNTEQWNPNGSEWHLDAKDTNKDQARLSFIPAASKQYLKNSDWSLPVAEGWTTSNVTATFDTTTFESGTRSLKVTATTTAGYIRQLFSIERDVMNVSYGVRVMPMGNQTLRAFTTDGIETANPAYEIPAYAAWVTATAYVRGDIVTNGGYSYRAVSAHTGGTFATDLASGLWEENWITLPLRFDVEDSAASIDFRFYPDIVGGSGIAYVDQVWAVRGHFTSAPRLYEQKLLYLTAPITLVSGAVTVNTNTAYTLAGAGADIPTNAVGYIVRLKAKGNAAATYPCAANMFTNEISVQPRQNNTNAAADFTIMNLSGDTIQATVGNVANTLTYEAKLIGWVTS